jgi:hypothetical protein
LLLLFLSFLAFYIFMTLEISLPFWENLPLVPFIQYSWRFLAVIMFVTAFLAASIPSFYSSSERRESRSNVIPDPIPVFTGTNLDSRFRGNDKPGSSRQDGYRTVTRQARTISKYIAFAILILLLPVFYAWYLRPSVYFTKSELDFDSPNFLAGVRPESGNLLPETGYMPKWTQVLPSIDELPESEAKIISGEPKRDPSDLVFAPQSPVEAVKLTAHKKQYSVHAEGKMTVRFYTHYFPGWKVSIDKKPLPLCPLYPELGRRANPPNPPNRCVSYDNIYGYMDVPLSKGKHTVLLSFENTPIRTAGNWISLISLIGLVGLPFVRVPRG